MKYPEEIPFEYSKQAMFTLSFIIVSFLTSGVSLVSSNEGSSEMGMLLLVCGLLLVIPYIGFGIDVARKGRIIRRKLEKEEK